MAHNQREHKFLENLNLVQRVIQIGQVVGTDRKYKARNNNSAHNIVRLQYHSQDTD